MANANYEYLLEILNEKLGTKLTMLQIFQAIIEATEEGETHEFVKYLDCSGCDECGVMTLKPNHVFNKLQMEMETCNCGHINCKMHPHQRTKACADNE